MDSKASLGLHWLPSPSNSLFASSPCLQVQKSAKSSNTSLPDKLPDQQVLEDLKAVLKARLDLKDNQDDLSLGRCAVILDALQNPQPNTFVITNVRPAEYTVVLAFISEESDCGIRAKFNYFEDTQELQIMTPLPIHEQPGSHLFKAVAKYTDVHPPDSDAEIEIPRPVNKWVGECGLSSDDNKWDRWHQPKEDSHASKVLRAGPTIDYEDFIPRRIKKSLKFGPVTIHSHVWIDVSEVRYTVFKRGADGHFDFNSKNLETFAEGTVYPKIKMDDIECMLGGVAERLKDYIVSLMEGMGLEESSIRSAHKSHPVWDPMWEAAVNQISTAVYLTAYCRYVDWHHHKYEKRKLSHQAVTQATTTTSGTSLSSTDPTAGSSSDPTTSSSSDEPHTPSTGLSVDVELERAVKKAKVGDDKSPEAKAKKSRPKKGKGRSL
ncbi:uncharacterized protein F5147DRAFT_658269 [Suillus discolor]|uniref:Uncharacterized protein n=1 Tax=Suillus discolor TaxID=1912936 RepID=A0A9P7EUW6_9AGAM|nr:uncharacterized protein F5147DRAFT_658269 [Suillus discolor]KAG2090006.1 hypothetical protein F5147DRAFT_658269 [Suillus discolor]